MTLEEAKKEIAGRKAMYDSIVDRISDPYNTARDFYKGEASGLSEAIDILANVDTKPVGNPDKLTLTELAHELRKIFKFRYLTVTDDFPLPTIMMWAEEVEYDGRGWNIVKPKSYYGSFNVSALCIVLDLSEYKGEDGNIDYSKCLVEVEG